VSVPFERFTDLKARIEARRFWWRGAAQWEYLEAKWKPKAWKTPHRLLFIRTRVKQQHKESIQLDLFVPHDYGYEFKVLLTNKSLGAWTRFGAGSQRAGRLVRPQGQLTSAGPPIRRSKRSCCITDARPWKVILRTHTQCNTVKKAVL